MSPTDDARDWTSVLAEIPLFQGLSNRDLRRVATVATVRRYHEQTEIIRAGEPGDALYVVLDGSVSVHRRGLRRSELGIGSVFGEMSLLDGGPRSATVFAAEPVTCLRIARPRFAKLLRSEPGIAIALLEELTTRLRTAQAMF